MTVKNLIRMLQELEVPDMDVVIKGRDGIPYDFDIDVENVSLVDGEPQFAYGMELLVVSLETRSIAACTDTLY